ncbi:hypothetical protein ACF1GT_03265 [Streptomyces sp. NPDC014636]|uniref:hypothetical protein n=1 Tax=Streptomyces sp. NPDC014636 TaxID=3364876 RepID=UPI0036FDC9EF
MAGSAHATLDAVSHERSRRTPVGTARAARPPAAVAAAFAQARQLVVRPGRGLGRDETAHAARIGRPAPAAPAHHVVPGTGS